MPAPDWKPSPPGAAPAHPSLTDRGHHRSPRTQPDTFTNPLTRTPPSPGFIPPHPPPTPPPTPAAGGAGKDRRGAGPTRGAEAAAEGTRRRGAGLPSAGAGRYCPPDRPPASLLLPCLPPSSLPPSLPARPPSGRSRRDGGWREGRFRHTEFLSAAAPLHQKPGATDRFANSYTCNPSWSHKTDRKPVSGMRNPAPAWQGSVSQHPPPHTHTGAPPAARPHHFPSLHAVSTDRPVPSSPAGAAPPRQREVLREGERLRPWGFGSCEAGRGGFARLSVWAAGAECSEARARPRRMAASCPLKLSRGPALSPHPGYVPLHPSHHLSHVPVQHTTPQELTSFIFKKPSDEPSEVRPLKGSHPQGRKFDPWCWNSTTRSSRLCCFLLWSMPWHYRENPTGGWGKCMDRKVCLRLALVWWSGCSLKEAFQGPGGLPLLNPQCCDSVCGKGCKSSDSCFRS